MKYGIYLASQNKVGDARYDNIDEAIKQAKAVAAHYHSWTRIVRFP